MNDTAIQSHQMGAARRPTGVVERGRRRTLLTIKQMEASSAGALHFGPVP
jgi:hypothetical protein